MGKRVRGSQGVRVRREIRERRESEKGERERWREGTGKGEWGDGKGESGEWRARGPGLDIKACPGQVATSVGQVHNPGHVSHQTGSCRCNTKHVLFILIKRLKCFDLLTPKINNV